MKQLISEIGKRMPYVERDGYVDDLIDRATQGALNRTSRRGAGKRHWVAIASMAAAALLLVGIGLTVLNQDTAHQTIVMLQGDGPIDQFLGSLTDEEVAQLPYYEIEEVPEY